MVQPITESESLARPNHELARCAEVTICELTSAEQFLVWALRWRSSAQDDEQFADDCLRDSFDRAGIREGHRALDAFVCATCPIRLSCPTTQRLGCWRLNAFEAHSLHAVGCLQSGLLGEAWRALRAICPDAQLQAALESLQELGSELARSGGMINRWRDSQRSLSPVNQ